MEVLEYKKLSYFNILRIVEEKNILEIQGRPVILDYSKNFSKDLLEKFFAISFKSLSKIVLLKDSKYSTICDKYKNEHGEPFDISLDISDELKNNTEKIINFILE